MNNEIKEEKDKRAIWWRGLYMLLFAFLYGVAKVVIVAVVVFQFVYVLIKGEENEQLLKFGKRLGKYMYEILLFQTFNNENHPFPLGPWPNEDTE